LHKSEWEVRQEEEEEEEEKHADVGAWVV